MVAGNKDPLFYIQNEMSGHHYLVDTGAQVSIIPVSTNGICLQHTGPAPVAANGTPICSWTFIIADVKKPILGAESLSWMTPLQCIHLAWGPWPSI